MEEKKLVPKLRFPGFTEPWEQRKFSDIFAEVKSGLSLFTFYFLFLFFSLFSGLSYLVRSYCRIGRA